jgi:hypothetical protein
MANPPKVNSGIGQTGKSLLNGPLVVPRPPVIPKSKPAAILKPETGPVPIAPALPGKLIDGESCTKCKSTHLARPLAQLAVCNACGHHMALGKKVYQRPVSRVDLLGSSKHGSPYRY